MVSESASRGDGEAPRSDTSESLRPCQDIGPRVDRVAYRIEEVAETLGISRRTL